MVQLCNTVLLLDCILLDVSLLLGAALLRDHKMIHMKYLLWPSKFNSIFYFFQLRRGCSVVQRCNKCPNFFQKIDQFASGYGSPGLHSILLLFFDTPNRVPSQFRVAVDARWVQISLLRDHA